MVAPNTGVGTGTRGRRGRHGGATPTLNIRIRIYSSFRCYEVDIQYPAGKMPALQEFHDSGLYLIRAKSAV
ncbi:hypothetical protein FJR11_18290 [Anabaena sp. UHCC 0187]|nr:hypothetical protein [Anabaena sp. UHCC 0187]